MVIWSLSPGSCNRAGRLAASGLGAGPRVAWPPGVAVACRGLCPLPFALAFSVLLCWPHVCHLFQSGLEAGWGDGVS